MTDFKNVLPDIPKVDPKETPSYLLDVLSQDLKEKYNGQASLVITDEKTYLKFGDIGTVITIMLYDSIEKYPVETTDHINEVVYTIRNGEEMRTFITELITSEKFKFLIFSNVKF